MKNGKYKVQLCYCIAPAPPPTVVYHNYFTKLSPVLFTFAFIQCRKYFWVGAVSLPAPYSIWTDPNSHRQSSPYLCLACQLFCLNKNTGLWPSPPPPQTNKNYKDAALVQQFIILTASVSDLLKWKFDGATPPNLLISLLRLPTLKTTISYLHCIFNQPWKNPLQMATF